MRFQKLIKPALWLSLASMAQPALPRDVTLLEFIPKDRAPTVDAGTETPIAEILEEESGTSSNLDALMVYEFARHGMKSGSPPASAIPRFLPTDTLAIPLWMKPRRMVTSVPLISEASFASGLAGGRYDRCDTPYYAPAWWLDAKTEARRAYHFATVAAAACEYGVPTALLDAVVAQESKYKSWAISPKGAMGLMQIMPGTATQLGLSMPFEAASNIRAGARYLRQQLDRFGRVDLALAAYNAGPHRRSLREGRLPLIAETTGYVRTIMTNWGRLAPRTIETTSVDRGAVAAAAVAASPLRRATLVRYDGLAFSSTS